MTKMTKGLNQIAKESNENSHRHGFFTDEEELFNTLRSDQTFVCVQDKMNVIKSAKHAYFGQTIAMIHSELSEAIEADRINKRANRKDELFTWNERDFTENPLTFQTHYQNKMKGTVEDELIDALIRILGFLDHLNVDTEKHIDLKMRYNALREHKHGKSY